jgi:hypothetical protein
MPTVAFGLPLQHVEHSGHIFRVVVRDRERARFHQGLLTSQGRPEITGLRILLRIDAVQGERCERTRLRGAYAET